MNEYLRDCAKKLQEEAKAYGHRIAWGNCVALAITVLGAGRLSECSAAIDAVAPFMFGTENFKAEAATCLRNAEDAARGEVR